ncbi:MAG: hypothetical protein HQK49_09140 [Oligoflexia bacterium]|nr:hypothetical protein [Oligoflexia bacterium]
MNYCPQKMLLSENEINLLDYLFVNKVALPLQINRDIFTKITLSNVYKKLTSMEVANLINRHPIKFKDKIYQAISLTNQGLQRYLGGDSREGLRLQISSDKIAHDIRLLDIQYRFRQFKMVKDYFTENQIRSNSDHSRVLLQDILNGINCDSVVDVEFKQGRFYIPVEFELSPKSTKRYREIFIKYYINPKIDSVLYIVYDQNELDRLVTISKKVGQGFAHKIFFILFNDFIYSVNEVAFRNYFGQKIVIS